MESGILSIRTIFGQQRRHLVPLYQRPYVWKRQDQWEPLWDDLRGLAERLLAGKETRPHFLGAIVLDQVRQPTGYIESRWVIDGQQRLTTMQIVLEAFSDLCQEYGSKQKGSALLALTRNQNPMEEVKDVEFKVWPTNSDQHGFRTVMRAGSATEVKAAFDCDADEVAVGNTIGDAYLYFHRAIEQWLDLDQDGYEERLDALFRAIPDLVRMVVIDLGADDDAQLIFETLNARGTPLLPVDLVKNYLFHKARSREAGSGGPVRQILVHVRPRFRVLARRDRRRPQRPCAHRRVPAAVSNSQTTRRNWKSTSVQRLLRTRGRQRRRTEDTYGRIVALRRRLPPVRRCQPESEGAELLRTSAGDGHRGSAPASPRRWFTGGARTPRKLRRRSRSSSRFW
ncbi:MAG: DUF262 domain-containing protein [bacterium]|nr:DUF262 domain-containing protein [bacterium]